MEWKYTKLFLLIITELHYGITFGGAKVLEGGGTYKVMDHFVGCFENSPDAPAFSEFPSAPIDDGLEGTATGCADACGHSTTNYAGINSLGYCFCANALPTGPDTTANCAACANAAAEKCGNVVGYISVYKTTVSKVANMQVEILPGPYNMQQNVIVNYTQIYDTVYVRVIYGDNDKWTFWHIGKKNLLTPHSYSIPGTFDILVQGVDTDMPEEPADLDGEVTVLVPILNEPMIECPSSTITYTEITCNVTVVIGEDVTITVDYGDATTPDEISIPDSVIEYLGTPIAQVPLDKSVSSVPTDVIAMPSRTVSAQGYLLFFEALVEVATISTNPVVTFMVLIPECADAGTTVCADTGACESICPPECAGSFDLSTGQCSGGGSSPSPKFTTRTTVTSVATDVVGPAKELWKFVRTKPKDLTEVFPGDVIAFKTTNKVYQVNATLADMQYVEASKTATSLNVNYMVGAAVSSPTEADFTHIFTDGDTFTVTVTLDSRLTNTTTENTTQIVVESGIDGLIIQPEEEYTTANTPMFFATYYETGPEANVTIDFADQSPTESVWAGKQAIIVSQHSYSSFGVYNVTAVALSGLTSATNSCLITIITPVTAENWTVEFEESKVLYPPGEAVLKLIFSGSPDMLPTKATAIIVWQDGETSDGTIFIGPGAPATPSGPPQTFVYFVIDHSYKQEGLYTVVVNISNSLSSITLNQTVEVIQAIEGLAVDMTFFLNPNTPQKGTDYANAEMNTFLQKGIGPQLNVFPKDVIVVFTISKLKGRINECELQLGDSPKVGLPANTPNAKPVIDKYFSNSSLFLVRLYPQQGDYEHIVMCMNSVSNSTVTVNFKLLDGLDSLNVSEFQSVTNISNPKVINVTGDLDPETVCIQIEFGDFCKPHTFGNQALCNTLYPSSVYNSTYALPQLFSHQYNDSGEYIIKVTAKNDGGSVSRLLTFQMTFLACEPAPTAKIRIDSDTNKNEDPKNPSLRERSKGLKILTEMGMDTCTMNIIVEREWTVTEVKEDGITVIQPIVVKNQLSSWNLSALYIPAVFLELGLYRIVFYATITPVRSNSEQKPIGPKYSTSAFVYVRIEKSKLIPVMVYGSMTVVQRSRGQFIEMDPKELSIDPDNPSEKHFTVEWSCHAGLQMLPPAAKTTPTPVKVLTKKQRETESYKDGDGCFGTGEGLLDTTNGNWNLDTGDLLPQTDQGQIQMYTIFVVVKKDDRKGTAKLVLNVTEWNAPAIRIRCRDKNLCFPTSYGVLVNPTTRLALSSDCLQDCCDKHLHDFTLNWSVIETGGGVKPGPGPPPTMNPHQIPPFRTLSTDHIVGMLYHEIAVDSEFFKVHNQTARFGFKLVASCTKDSKPGSAILMVQLNKPPASTDKCTITSSDNLKLALKTKFRLSCTNWADPEGSPIHSYRFYATKNTKFTQSTPGEKNEWDIILCNSRLPYCDIVLPCGKLNIYVDVQDNMWANTTQFIDSVELLAPDDVDNYTKSDEWIEIMKANGNQFEMIQKFQALTSVQECKQYVENVDDKIASMKRFLDSMNDVNLESYADALLYTSTLGSFLMDGAVIDSEAKEKIVQLLAKVEKCMKNSTNDIPLEPLRQLTKNTVEIMGVLASVGTKTTLEGKILPTDRRAANTMDYEADLVDTDMSEHLTMDELYRRAIVDQDKQNTRRQLEQLDSLMDDMAERVLNLMVVDEKEVDFHSPLASAVFKKFRHHEELNNTFQFGNSLFNIPNVTQLLIDVGIHPDEPIGVAAVEWQFVLKATGKNLKLVSPQAKSVQIDIYNATISTKVARMHITNVSLPFDIFLPQRPLDFEGKKNNMSDNFTEPIMKWYEYMAYHQINITKPASAMIIHIILRPGDSNARLLLYVRYNRKPVLDQYDHFFKLYEKESINDSYIIFLSTNDLHGNLGEYYIGVAQLKDGVNVPAGSDATKEMVQNFTIAYKAKLTATGCYYYNEYYADWMADGCYVHSATDIVTQCKCFHLTAFAGGLVVVPNAIDFSYVFANASFADNLTIYATIILTLLIFVIFLIWARRKDNRDQIKIGALSLPDNGPQDKYLYEILVFTGHARTASCDSKVSFVLSGDKEETEVRTFGTQPRKVFRRDGVDVFIMAAPRPLGQLQYLRMWHDNSGKDTFGSWQLDYVVFRDVQTGEKFEFIANCWLALEHDDGETDRIFAVAGKEQLTEFNHLFSTSSRKNLSDGHLWFSIFLRPPRSRFTRCQRVSSCMALLYLSMLVNAMWYGTVPEKPPTDSFKLGPLNLSLEQISVGFFSNLIVFPPSFLIIFLFRKSRPRKLRPSRVDEALKKQRDAFNASKPSSASTSKPKKTEAEQDRINRLYQRKKRFTLPWWFTIIAWILCVFCICISIFFLWAYGITFGDDKTKKWITSLIISFFMSILLIQPIKVLFMAIIFSSLCKKVETDEDDADEDELDPSLEYDEEWPQGDPTNPRKIAIKPKDPAEVEALRLKRIREKKLWEIMREIFGYLIFLWILSVVTTSVRDPNAFFLRKGILDEFVREGRKYDFNKVTNLVRFREWMTCLLIPRLRPTNFYNGQTRIGWVGFTDNGVNRIMGKAIVRQVRARDEGHCSFNHVMDMYNITCRRTYVTKMTMSENDQDYLPHWKTLNGEDPTSRNIDEYYDAYKPFAYSTAEEYKSTVVIGNLDAYSGNGYVFELKGRYLVDRFQKLLDLDWIDNRTRAVIIEFSVYNAQVDLFGVVKLLVEVTPGGGMHTYVRINPVRLLSLDQGLGNLHLICQAVFLIYIIYYTVRELYRMCTKGKKYFMEFWSGMELFVIIMAWAAIGTYIARFFILRGVMKKAKETNYEHPVELPLAQNVDEMFSYLISMTMYLSIIKLNKLLRFNNRLTMLAQTIAQCMRDLGGFFLVILILFIAFGLLFQLLFKDLSDCRTFYGSVTTLFSIAINKFNFQKFLDSRPYFGPLVFFVFSFLFSIVLMNVFLSILLGSFERVKKDITQRPSELHMMNFLVIRLKGMVGIGPSRRRINPKSKEDDTKLEEIDGATAELPEKVDRLLDYINDVYFDGRLDMNDKKMLKGTKHGILKSD